MTEKSFTHQDLAALLAPAMGQLAATAVVEEVCVKRLAPDRMGFDMARKVLADVADLPGLAGITGRVALARLGNGGGWSSKGTTAPPTMKRRSMTFIIEALSASVGEERAREVVLAAVVELAIPPGPITFAQALALLEHLAKMPGSLGIAARFAKGRIHLSW